MALGICIGFVLGILFMLGMEAWADSLARREGKR